MRPQCSTVAPRESRRCPERARSRRPGPAPNPLPVARERLPRVFSNSLRHRRAPCDRVEVSSAGLPPPEERLHHVVEDLALPWLKSLRLTKHALQLGIGIGRLDVLVDQERDGHAEI